MLKEIAPRLARAALLGNPKTTAYDYFLQAAEATAPSLAIEVVPGRVETAADIERVIVDLSHVPNSGLFLPPDTTTAVHRDFIIALASRHRLPSVYSLRVFVTAATARFAIGIDQQERFHVADERPHPQTAAVNVRRECTPDAQPIRSSLLLPDTPRTRFAGLIRGALPGVEPNYTALRPVLFGG
jgi:hypothetical protein